jgi:2-keto-4-pentenoate hydratase/2-oxohepta-3-ene-1,7-dioic acid hydratase in catechol pathway
MKSPRTIVGPGVAVKLPAHSKAVDWEVELVAVIGRKATRVPLAAALDHVAGYTIGNDLSARDIMKREQLPDTSPFKFDWVAQKCFDDCCPLGPWIVPASEIADPQKLDLKLWVNGTIKQDSNTSKMIFTLAEQLSQLSTYVTLYPGDLILTGTPSGVGAARREFLKPGDTAKLWIEGIGTLENRMT